MTQPATQSPDDDEPTSNGTRPPMPHEVEDHNLPRESKLDESLDRIVEEGRPRLYRRWPELLTTAFIAGMEVALGVLALLWVENETGSAGLAGLAFSFGFIALLLGHSELFTEGFLVPVTVVAAGEARTRHLIRFWFGTLVGNLAGGWVGAWLTMTALPELHATARQAGTHYVNAGVDGRTLALAVLAGSAITLMTRMQNGTDDVMAKLIASIGAAFLLAGVGLFHSILDSLIAFNGLLAGHAPYSYLDWLGWFGWAVLGNVIGGVGLTTLLRLIRSRRQLSELRAKPPEVN
ncbi:MAG TPA: formate/nitrite transporter family protein [Acidothermaceae bacterium]|nr:formate/nitrite transporter family protein [Acidothermaceae bacterium]